jgi:hypothetical protein
LTWKSDIWTLFFLPIIHHHFCKILFFNSVRHDWVENRYVSKTNVMRQWAVSSLLKPFWKLVALVWSKRNYFWWKTCAYDENGNVSHPQSNFHVCSCTHYKKDLCYHILVAKTASLCTHYKKKTIYHFVCKNRCIHILVNSLLRQKIEWCIKFTLTVGQRS